MPRQSTKILRICPTCQKEFLASRRRVQQGGGRFCSLPCFYLFATRPVEERFWEKVQKTEGDGCWIWLAKRNLHDYGVFYDGIKFVPAHRFAWSLVHGPIPEGMEVCHNCPSGDNPCCVRHDHLWLGTHAENMADMKAKGRSNRGERNGKCMLTADDVRSIRLRYGDGKANQRQLAEEYCTTQQTISSIVLRKKWKHLPG